MAGEDCTMNGRGPLPAAAAAASASDTGVPSEIASGMGKLGTVALRSSSLPPSSPETGGWLEARLGRGVSSPEITPLGAAPASSTA